MRKTLARWLLLMALALPAAAAEPWDALQEGGALIVMRHAATDPGVGDPPGFRLSECATQRNLSPQGRQEAERLGRLFAARGVAPAAVYSSAWCRCLETAKLAFPAVPAQPLPALDSMFGDAKRAAGAPALRAALKNLPRDRVTVWVTHQVNVTALTGEYVGMGEALVLRVQRDGDFKLVGRLKPPES